MIHLNCANCGQTLKMDAAFAGGVCRCCYCGTIQTVPAHMALRGAAAAGTTAPATQARPLYRREEEMGEDFPGSAEWVNTPSTSGSFSAIPSDCPRDAEPSPADPRLAVAVGGAATMTLVAAGVAIALLGSSDAMNPAPAGAVEQIPALTSGIVEQVDPPIGAENPVQDDPARSRPSVVVLKDGTYRH